MAYSKFIRMFAWVRIQNRRKYIIFASNYVPDPTEDVPPYAECCDLYIGDA